MKRLYKWATSHTTAAYYERRHRGLITMSKQLNPLHIPHADACGCLRHQP